MISRKQKLLNSIKNVKEINYKLIGRKLGSGAEGIVFEYGKTKVLKISDYSFNSHKYDLKLFAKLKEKNFPFVAKIFNFGSVQIYDDDLKCLDYWYIAEKLNPLSNWETKTFELCWDSLKYNYYSDYNQKYIPKGAAAEKVRSFRDTWENVKMLDFSDDHSRNIGKDKKGNWKVLDLCAIRLK